MARAAAGLARVCAQLLGGAYGARVLLLVGAGNNGGDALHAGALLARPRCAGGGAAAGRPGARGRARRAAPGRRPGRRRGDGDVGDVDLVLDGILGIGGRGGLRGPRGRGRGRARPTARWSWPSTCPAASTRRTGEVAGAAVRADVTVTFGALKTGLLVDPGAAHAGVVELVDIGLDLPPAAVEVLQADDVAGAAAAGGPRVRQVPPRRRGRGRRVARSTRGPPCSASAARCGAVPGWCATSARDEPAALVRARWPEVGGRGGPGAGLGRGVRWRRRRGRPAATGRWPTTCPTVVDADALDGCSRQSGRRGRSVPLLLTPHAGELARLVGADRDDVEARRLHHARRRRRSSAPSCCSRGRPPWSPSPDGRVRVNPTGTPALATAGSGDVLAGAVRRPAGRRAGPVRRRLGRRLAARAGRPAGLGRRRPAGRR